MNLNEAIDFICEESARQGADQYDALAMESENTGLEIFESKIKNTEISASRGLGVRLFKGRRPGFAFTEKVSKEAIKQAVEDAMNHAQITDEMDLDLPEPELPAEVNLKNFNPELENVTFEQMKELGLRIEAAARKGDSRIENVPYLGVGRGSGRVLIKNSRGVFFESEKNSISAYVGTVAVEGDSRKMGVYSNGGRSLDLEVLDPEFMAGKAVERSIELLGARPAPGGVYPIVMSNRVSGRLMGMFTSPFYAENVQKGQSRLQDRVGDKIAVTRLNLSCRPHEIGMPGSRLFDGEGVITGPRNIIKNGVLEGYLYNLEASIRDGVTPTGNASRSYTGKAGTGFSNLIVDKGESELVELLKTYPECIYVTKLEGGSGCSAISGEISIGIQGFLYRNGEMVQPVENMTLNSNYFDLLPLIRGISNQYSDGFSSVKVPDILFEKMHVAA